MSPEAWLTAAVVLAVLVGLWREFASPSFLVFTGVVILLVAQVITPGEAFAGFSNPAPFTVAALFVVARAVSKTGVLDSLTNSLLGDRGHTRRPMLRLLAPTVFSSGFIANTPLVAMLIPQVTSWARRRGVDASRFLMPLSFGAILGGTLTLIGTSTNIVVAGQVQKSGIDLGFFEIGVVGLPIAVGGVFLVVLLAPRVLANRRSPQGDVEQGLRNYTIEMTVVPRGPIEGKTVQTAGLRNLRGVFLVSVDRGDTTIAPAGPSTVLRGGNILRFVGDIGQVLNLQTLPGLEVAQLGRMAHQTGTAEYFTVVVGVDSPLVGHTLKDVGFRSTYQAAAVAIHRSGHRIEGKLGEVTIHVGDALVVIADPGFQRRWQHRPDFLLVSSVDEAEPPSSSGGGRVLLLLIAMIALAALGYLPILQGSVLVAVLLVLMRILSVDEARRAVDIEVIGLIASAFGLAAAVEVSGLATLVADGLGSVLGGLGPIGALLGVILATVALTELVTNNAAALLILPIALASAPAAGIDPRGMAITVAIASSASFLTPIGYQTNTMVFGPGGYRVSDYLKLGTPLTTLVAVVLLLMIPALYGIPA